MRVEATRLHVEGTVKAALDGPAYLFARRRGDVMEVVAPARLDGGTFSADIDLAELALPGDQRDVWNLRLVAGRKSLRLGRAEGGEAPEYPAAEVDGRRLRPYFTVQGNVSVRSVAGGAPPAPAAEPATRPRLARRLLGPPAILVHRLALRLASALIRPAANPTGATSASCCCTRRAWAARSGQR